jgi:hypothetical protein
MTFLEIMRKLLGALSSEPVSVSDTECRVASISSSSIFSKVVCKVHDSRGDIIFRSGEAVIKAKSSMRVRMNNACLELARGAICLVSKSGSQIGIGFSEVAVAQNETHETRIELPEAVLWGKLHVESSVQKSLTLMQQSLPMQKGR